MAGVMVVCPGPYPWYQFFHSIVTSQTLSACGYKTFCDGFPWMTFELLIKDKQDHG